jgi:glycosyltransferase involved in cell wall biosynthesis
MRGVAYIIGSFPLRSETFVYREVMGLRERGLDVDVFSVARPSPAQAGEALEATRGLRIEYISRLEAALSLARPVPRKVSDFNARLQREATLKSRSWLRLGRAQAIAARLRSGRYARIHSHWPYGHQLAALAHLLTGIPSSISVHAHEVAHDNGHFDAVFELIDFAAFCNDAARRFLLERVASTNAGKCKLVYHGVDLAAFPALGPSPAGGRLRLVSAGRLTPTKGFARLLRVVAELGRRDVPVELTIVGDGSQREALLSLAAELGITDRVSLTGWLEPTALRQTFEASDVFCLLADTTYHDGLPNVLLEAQALGRPVVVSSLPAATEAVTDGVDGFVVGPDDTEAACAVLTQLAREPALRLRLAAAARARVERQHDARYHLGQLHQLLLSRSGAALSPRAA